MGSSQVLFILGPLACAPHSCAQEKKTRTILFTALFFRVLSLFSLFVTSLLSFSQAYDKRLASLPKSASAADSARSTDAMAYGASAASGSGSYGITASR